MSEDDATDVFCGLYLGAVSCMGGNRTHEKSGGVSVLIPCYGKSLYVKEAVESCLNQTMKAEKVIVLLMDDDSIGRTKVNAYIHHHSKHNKNSFKNFFSKDKFYLHFPTNKYITILSALQQENRHKKGAFQPLLIKISLKISQQ